MRRLIPSLLLLLALGTLPGQAPLGPPCARAEAASEARTAAEVYERKSHLLECLLYVARDLKSRWEAVPDQPPAQLLLVIDPSTSMKDEIAVIRAGLPDVWREGPPGLQVGVHGIGAGEYQAPSRLPGDADGVLASLAFLPWDGPKNLLEGVRAAAGRLEVDVGGPKALLLVSQDFEGAEDDVEETREAIFDCGASFYCVASEAGFERAWLQEFEARDHPDAGLRERYNPEPRKREAGALYYGGEVAFGLIPYRWEFDLAQSDFVWSRPPRYPVPSGFGYWSLATLCFTAGGRYFVYDFDLPADHPSRVPLPEEKLEKLDPAERKLHERRQAQLAARRTTYDFSRLGLLAPDLRPRKKVLKDLGRDWRAQTIVRVWEHLANDALPVLQRLGALERRGGTLATRPERAVRSSTPPLTWFTDMKDVKKAQGFLKERLSAVETALKWWEAANGKERKVKPGADALNERIEADFQLLGVQLRKVRFHHNEALAALKTIKPLDVTYRQVRLLPQPILTGVAMPDAGIELGDDERNARFSEVFLAQARMANRYPGTPWEALLKKGWMLTFRKDVQILPQEREVRRTRPEAKDGKGKKDKPVPAPAPKPRPKPPPGARPGSGGGGPVTGGK
jgi:hypothetical protein